MALPKTGPPRVTQRVEYDASHNPIYVGEAEPDRISVDPAAAIWRIRRISYTSGDPTLIEWADGDLLYDNIWNNRAGLIYH